MSCPFGSDPTSSVIVPLSILLWTILTILAFPLLKKRKKRKSNENNNDNDKDKENTTDNSSTNENVAIA